MAFSLPSLFLHYTIKTGDTIKNSINKSSRRDRVCSVLLPHNDDYKSCCFFRHYGKFCLFSYFFVSCPVMSHHCTGHQDFRNCPGSKKYYFLSEIQNLCLLIFTFHAGCVFPCSMKIQFNDCWGMLLTSGENADRVSWETVLPSAMCGIHQDQEHGRMLGSNRLTCYLSFNEVKRDADL